MSRPRPRAGHGLAQPRTKPEVLAELADPQEQFLLFINGIENLNMMLPADPKMIAAGPISSHLQMYFEMCRNVRNKLLDIEFELLERAIKETAGMAGKKPS